MFLFSLLVSIHAQNEIKNSVFVLRPNIDFYTVVVNNLKEVLGSSLETGRTGKLN